MKTNEINTLLQELERDWKIVDIVSFNELNLSEKLNIWPYELVRFNDQLLREKAKLNEVEELKDRVYGKEYDQLRFHSDKSLTKQEIEQYYLPSNPDVIKVNRAVKKQEMVVDYFESCVKLLNGMVWNAKLFMEDRKHSG